MIDNLESRDNLQLMADMTQDDNSNLLRQGKSGGLSLDPSGDDNPTSK